MVTPGERRALLFFACVLALGAGVRAVRSRHLSVAPTTQTALAEHMRRVDSARIAGARRRAGRRRSVSASRSAARDSVSRPVDLDRATAQEIEELPGIGKVVAARIVADRDSLGAFRSLDGLQRVKGIGPKLAKRLEPHVTFSTSH